MDISKYTIKWLTAAALTKMDGERYEGVIDDVREQVLLNKYTLVKEVQPVIVFVDSWQIVPNQQMRHALREKWGSETIKWTGRRVVIFQRQGRKALTFPDADVLSWRGRTGTEASS
jgi:hypothetical protein